MAGEVNVYTNFERRMDNHMISAPNSRKNVANTWYILAPHLSFPLRNGADIYAAGVASGLSYTANTVLIGASSIRHFRQGKVVEAKDFAHRYRSKLKATLLALLRQKSYQLCKFNTRQFTQMVRSLPVEPYDNIIYSYSSTAEMDRYFTHIKGYKVVLTHNYDIDFFDNIRKGLATPIHQLAMTFTIRHISNWLQQHQAHYLFAHINEVDAAHYSKAFPQMRSLVLKAGTYMNTLHNMVAWRRQYVSTNGPLRLCFTGYLNGQQNLEALSYFASHFWPAFQKTFAYRGVVFTAIGSEPSGQVKTLIAKCGWQLQADLEDEAFAAAIASCHFAVLPFPFTSGTKLKLLSAISHGVPILATTCMAAQGVGLPPSCHVSDDPTAWAAHAEAWLDKLVSDETLAALYQIGNQFSWQNICTTFTEQLSSQEATNCMFDNN
jgi:glycosyltransferase involved in cell wall biosynthesis